MNFVVYDQKETLFKRHHDTFHPKARISLHLAGVRSVLVKIGERGIPCSDETLLCKEVDGCTN